MPCWKSFKWHQEKVIGEWSAKKAAKVFVVLSDSWGELGMKKNNLYVFE